LVYFEETADVKAAIDREKQIKGWLRAKKVAVIKKRVAQGRSYMSAELAQGYLCLSPFAIFCSLQSTLSTIQSLLQ
jgi:hypothetical protein